MQTDEEIVRGCVRKDPKAQRKLYDKYSSMLFGVCKRYGRNLEDAEDIFQEAFVKAFDQIDTFAFRGPLAGWLRRLFVRCALNFYRYDKSRLMGTEEEYMTLPSEPVQLSNLSTEYILDRLAELPEEYRLVFNLVEVEGYSYKEVGEMIGGSEVSLRGVNFRAKRMLRAKLQGEGAEYEKRKTI